MYYVIDINDGDEYFSTCFLPSLIKWCMKNLEFIDCNFVYHGYVVEIFFDDGSE